MVVHAYNLSTWEAESGGIRVQSLSGLCNKFQARLDCIETVSDNKRKHLAWCLVRTLVAAPISSAVPKQFASLRDIY